MKKIRLLIFALSVAIVGCQTHQGQKNKIQYPKTNNRLQYPAIVDSLGVQRLYDKTKWRMYLLVCEDTPMLRSGAYLFSPPRCFGALDLKFDSLWQSNDSIAFYFDFYVNDTLSLHEILMSKYPRYMKTGYFNGMLFIGKKGAIKKDDSLTTCYVSNHSNFDILCIGPILRKVYDTTSDRIINPLQPEVIKFIRKNRDQLNPWFCREAIKRGVIK